MEFTRRVYEDGKITIPKELRDLHGISEGTFVRLQIVEILAAPAPPVPAVPRREVPPAALPVRALPHAEPPQQQAVDPTVARGHARRKRR